MNWTGDLRAVEDGQYLLTLYRQDGREFCRLSDAADTLPTDADIVARVRLFRNGRVSLRLLSPAEPRRLHEGFFRAEALSGRARAGSS